ncbi:hypothetical protein PQQ96_16325 [Paraburkholderia sediminicola]|uniref:hypothetical protein n=1 Tax=Paraburkholderia sediminicola TaxID=458836 RepID=UPI0038BCC4F0
MNKKIVGAALGLAFLAASSVASAHVDVAVGIGIPVGVYAPPPPVYLARPVVYGPAPVAVAYGGYNGWRGREWREQEWRREQWREHEWHDRGHWRGY